MTRNADDIILESLNALDANLPSLRFGIVSATSPLSVKLGGSATALTSVKKLAAYSAPVTGDLVLVVMLGGTAVVLGKVS